MFPFKKLNVTVSCYFILALTDIIVKLSLGTSVYPELEKVEFELVFFYFHKNLSHFAAQDHCLLILVNDLLSR